MVYGKMSKGIPPLRKQKRSKKSQEKDDEIKKKLYTANRNRNYWEFKLHSNKLEWVNQINKNKRNNPIQFLQRNIILIKILERLVGLSIHY